MFDDRDRLHIFEQFEIDRKLPKFQSAQEPGQLTPFGDSGGLTIRPSRRGQAGVVQTVVQNSEPFHLTWLQRLFIWFLFKVTPEGKALVFRPLTDTPTPPPEITVHEFFSSIKDSQEDLEVVDGRARGYEAALVRARKTGQVALAEQLKAGIEAVRAETQLLAMGLDRTLSPKPFWWIS